MTQDSSSLQLQHTEREMDRWIESATRSVGYEHGFGVRGCDLSQAEWWASYIRQSLEEQKSNSRLVEYLRTCAQEAKRLGVIVPREYIFYDAVTGEHLGRPGIIRVRKELAPARRIAGIIFPALDRLSREPTHIGIFEFEMDHLGVQCHYADVPSGSDLMVQMVRQNMAYAAKFVKLVNRKNNRAGNVGRALKGIAPAFRASYGYVYQAEYREANGRRSVTKAWWEVDTLGPDGKPEHPGPAWVVQRVFGWIGAEEKSLHWVAAELNRMEIPTAFGRRWNPGKVHRLVRNRCYTGKHAYNVHARVPGLNQPMTDITAEIKRNRKEVKPESEWVYFDVPVLVSEGLWDRANEVLTKRGAGRGKQGKSIEALLRGRVYCPGCGESMVVRRHTRDKDRIYYHCRKYGQKWQERPCIYRKFIPATVEQVIWADLCSLLRNDNWLDTQVGEVQREDHAVQKIIRQQDTKIAQSKSKRMKVQQGFEGGIYTLEQAKSRIVQLDADIADGEQEIERLRRRGGTTSCSGKEITALKEELRELRDRNLDDARFRERADIIARLGLQIFPSEDLKSMRVKCRIPLDDGPDGEPPLMMDTETRGAKMTADEREPTNGCGKVPPAPPGNPANSV